MEPITLAHGSGGKKMVTLIEDLFLKKFNNHNLPQGNDFTSFEVSQKKLAISTDSYVISPLIFPGGDIGSLAVHGTVNDVCMSGAKPLYLSASFIIEEGLDLKILEKIVSSMAEASKKTGVPIITGDTKVVEKGKGDGLYINTTGIGEIPSNLNITGSNAKPGDKIIINGSIGDHGMAILSFREGLNFETTLQSDSAPLNSLIALMCEFFPQINCLRDPTRGGLAACLNELASQSKVAIKIFEENIPIKTEVHSACELLGLDPLNVANEGKLVTICPPEIADDLLKTMKSHPFGVNSQIIGEVLEGTDVFMETSFGGQRKISWPESEQLPRIC
ncbi:MAG: hydrogenase expression/formation protein HypE [Epsilonproteobacteria bacterium]|nr:MAG: hydrogenase expression/formation protein HypE [Campylobacterota bacterium]RLA66346.1 MAG: hydrogenase expression/formation protein HypE [Campylobacterota bacterium]